MKKKIPIFDLAYTAGYMDGDGCFYLGKQRTSKRLKQKNIASIAISSVNPDVLNFFKSIFGGTIYLINKGIGIRKPLYQFSLRKRASILMAQNIYQFLVEKKQECKMLLDFCDNNTNEHLIHEIRSHKDVANLISKYQKVAFEKLRNTIEPTIENYAYLAGFIDAECCFLIQKEKPKDKPNCVYKIVLACNNTKAPIFKWLLERFGGRINFIDRLNHQKGRKNQFQWRLTGRNLSKILGHVYPFLQYKKPVCEQLMKFYSTTLPNGGARHTEIFRTSYAEILKIRENIVHEVHRLNKKGISNLSG